MLILVLIPIPILILILILNYAVMNNVFMERKNEWERMVAEFRVL